MLIFQQVEENVIIEMWDFSFRKTFDMAHEVALEIAKNIHSRSEDQTHEIIDKDLNEPIGSVPIMEMSDSDIADDEVNEENDESSLGMCDTFIK